jgi:hypothetical protein
MDDLYVGVTVLLPSGHAAVNFVIMWFPGIPRRRGTAPGMEHGGCCLLSSLVALIAVSRYHLGAHWLSDAASGLAFGAAWIVVPGLPITTISGERSCDRLLVVAAATLALAGCNILEARDRYCTLRRQEGDLLHVLVGLAWRRLATTAGT